MYFILPVEALALTPATRACARGRFLRDFLVMCWILFAYQNPTFPHGHDTVAISFALLRGAQRLNIEFVLLLLYVLRNDTTNVITNTMQGTSGASPRLRQ